MTFSLDAPRPRRWSMVLGVALAIVAGLLVAIAEQQRLVAAPLPAGTTPITDAAFEQRVFAALSQPGFLDRAMQAASQMRERERSRTWRTLLASEPSLLDPRGPFAINLGSLDATRRALVFVDYNCPHCRNLDRELARLRAMQPDTRIIAMPVALLRPSSGTAALSVLAAARLGKGPALHEALLRHDGEVTDDVVREEATRIGLSWDAVLTARGSQEVKDELARIAAVAQRIGVQGTPASFLSSGEVIGGATTADRFLAAWTQK